MQKTQVQLWFQYFIWVLTTTYFLKFLSFCSFVSHELKCFTTKLHKSKSYSFFIKSPVIREFQTVESNNHSLTLYSAPGRLLGSADQGLRRTILWPLLPWCSSIRSHVLWPIKPRPLQNLHFLLYYSVFTYLDPWH